jgi:hypothetical protein
MPTTNPSASTDVSEDSLTQPLKEKVQRGRLPTTRSQNRPTRNASRPDNHNVAPLLADYVSDNTSKTAASLPPIYLGDNKTKSKTNQSQFEEKKRKAPDVDSLTMSANMKGAAEPLMDDSAIGLVTSSGDTTCRIIPAASAPTLILTIEVAATNINSVASSATATEVLPRPEGKSTQINPEASPPTDDGADVEGAAPTDTTTKINAVASSATDGVGVYVTRSTKHIGSPSPPPDDGSKEALPNPVGTSTRINEAADDKS